MRHKAPTPTPTQESKPSTVGTSKLKRSRAGARIRGKSELKNNSTNNASYTILLLSISILLVSCTENGIRTPNKPLIENGSVHVVFCPECREAFIKTIQNTQNATCALYDVGSEIGGELAAVNARVITDDKTRAAYGEPIPGSGLMHHKFCVLDNRRVTSGSYNPTNGGERSRNNLIIIESPSLARSYEHQWNAVRERRREGARTRTVQLINESGQSTTITSAFCPADECEALVIETLTQAQEEVLFMTFSFTSDPIGDTLLALRNTGVHVEGACDNRQFRSERAYSECERLQAPLWSNAGGRGLLHHKVFIIDRETVITGSYNPTASGTKRNNENILIIHDATIAEAFVAEYEHVREVLATQQ